MIDGAYNIQIDTPLGRKQGKVVMRSEGSKAIADIDAPFVGKQRVEGRADGDTFTAEGEFKVKLVGKVRFSLTGVVEGDDVKIHIDSSKGEIELAGKRA